MLRKIYPLLNALLLLTIVVRGEDGDVPDYKALAAQLDFNDPNVSSFEMRRILTRAMISHPIPSFVIDDSVRDFEPTEEVLYMTVPDGRYLMQTHGQGESNLRKNERKNLEEFRSWLAKKDLKLPTGFDLNLEELRVLSCRDNDF